MRSTPRCVVPTSKNRPPANRWGALCLIAIACGQTGCRPADEIRTYRIAKPEDDNAAAGRDVEPTPVAKPAPQGEPTDRMLGAIVPGPDQAWFFKAVGPNAAIDPAADTIREFLGSVRFDGAKPLWETPEGWTEKRGEGMRLATLEIPTGDSSTELSVIGLGLAGDWDAQVLDNVNRWRKQLQLPPITGDALAKEYEPLDDAAEGAVLFDARGWFDGGTMVPFAGRAPFAGGATSAGGAPTAADAGPAAPAKPALPPAPASSELQSERPDGWTDGPQSAMRKASYKTPDGAEVTAFAFPAAGAMGERLANVNRWRGEVGLEPTTDEALAKEAESMPLLGEEGAYFELVGPTETTYAAMVVRGDLAWFFKLRGPGEAVKAERAAFRDWLASLSL